jgi:aspartate/methionine/tyrosine aminotransferase
MIEEFKFCWGEPYCVREALEHYYKRKTFKPIDINSIKYQPYEGDLELVKLTRQFIKETTGIDYKHVIITNGTTGALNIVLRAFQRKYNYKKCYTHKYYFSFYPIIIKKSNYEHKIGLYQNHEKELEPKDVLGIVDSPSNPTGDLLLYTDNSNNIIWDSVYHNPVFINTIPVKPDHRVNCGSYSKCFGVTGARVGWIATNHEDDFNLFKEENMYETCSVSYFSQNFLLDLMKNTDIQGFMKSSRYRVNNNREAFDKICYLFDGQAVPENGMFYAVWASPYAVKILDKLNVKTIEMDKLGNDRFLRFNLAQTNDLTKKAIRYIIKEDGKVI